jgi:hypothetical protein
MAYRKKQDNRYNVIAIPNGGKRALKTAFTLKKEGVRAGVWDLFLLTPCHGYAGLWIETKFGSNGLTEEQISFYEENKGKYQFSVYRDPREGLALVDRYLREGFGNYAGGSGAKTKLLK